MSRFVVKGIFPLTYYTIENLVDKNFLGVFAENVFNNIGIRILYSVFATILTLIPPKHNANRIGLLISYKSLWGGEAEYIP